MHLSLRLAALPIVAATLACSPAHGDPARAPLAHAVHAAPSPLDTVKTVRRSVTPLADGVYTIRHPDAPDTFPQGNTTVIVGQREVLVVDSCYLPSSAREDIAQIKQWTSLPVRYLVNTHWHYDHTMGNTAYRDAFASLAIVAHAETRKQMAAYDPGYLERFPTRAETFQKLLDRGSDDSGKAYTDGEKTELRDAIKGVVPVGHEFHAVVPRVDDMTPDVAFDHEMVVDLGQRRVVITFLGRGNTAGDAVVWLPAEKIVVAGDLLDHPVPYLGGGFPIELAATLKNLARLDATTIVPGHGDVLHDRAYLGNVIALIETVIAKVEREIDGGKRSKDLAEVKTNVTRSLDLAAYHAQFGGEDADNRDFFDDFALPGLITAAHAELWPR
jgi:cyclase